MTKNRVKINRAPVLTLWASVVAERLGHDHETALTLGKAVAGLNAQSKGRRLGIFDDAKSPSDKKDAKARQPDEVIGVTVLGRTIPTIRTPQGVRATAKGKPIDPQTVQRYLAQKFGADLSQVHSAMQSLAKAYPPKKLAGQAYAFYEAFRPSVPEGEKGWGAKGELDLEQIRSRQINRLSWKVLMAAAITAVHARADHSFSKDPHAQIELVAGHGVRGDAHYGVNVKHRSRVAKNPDQPNLRQVHLLHEELFAELRESGFEILPGQLGENITTRGLDVLSLSAGTQLRLGESAIVQLTGLRNPCYQIENFRSGLLAAVFDRGTDGGLIRKAGVMCIVVHGGIVKPGDPVAVVQEPPQHEPLQPV